MSRQTRLLNAHVELTAAIRASEEWESSYKASPSTFRRLLREEAETQASANVYLIGLASRVPDMVNWREAGLKPLAAAALPPAEAEVWTIEAQMLAAALADHIRELHAIGGNAGEDLYDIPLGITALDDAFVTGADKHTAQMVSQVTATTRRNIQKAIRQSIAQGEDIDASIARIRQLVASPVRAEMIAQTEAVNGYQAGLDIFGEQSGALSSTWDALINACRLCSPVDGTTVKLGEDFILGNGTPVKRPPGHTRCRCGRYLNYAD